MKASLHLRAIAAALAVVLTATITAPAFASSHTPPTGPFLVRTGVASSNNWTILPPLTSSSLNAISMTSTSNGWIVGDNGVSFHYNGSAWNPVATGVAPTINLNSVYAVPGTTEAWAVGDQGTILHFANGSWTSQPGVSTQQLDAVWMVSTTEGWAVGAGGTIAHYQGGGWTQVQPGTFTNQFHDVQMLSASSGFAVGEGGTVIQYNGSSWQPVNSGVSAALYGVWMTSASNGWVVGGSNPPTPTPSMILPWNGSFMSPVASPINTRLWYVFMTSPTEGWASLNGGYILHYLNGTWNDVFGNTTLTQAPLYGVWMPSPSEGWAVGASGVVLHYQVNASNLPIKLYLPFVER